MNHANTSQKKAGVAILILEKVDFIEIKSTHDDKGVFIKKIKKF